MSTVVLNGLTMDGSVWRVTDTDLLDGVAGRFASGDSGSSDGGWSGRSHRAVRTGTLEGTYKGTDPLTADQARIQLPTVLGFDDVPVTFWMPTGPQTVIVRRAGAPQWKWIGGNTARWSLSVKGDDPAVYLGDGVNPAWSGATARAYEVGGLTFPLGPFPITWGSGVVSGNLAYSNPGTTGRVELRLDGPLTDPTISTTNADGVRTLAWSLTIPDGAFLTIDPVRKESLLNGQASRPPSIRGWPRLTPGSNTWQFHAGGASTGTLTVNAYPAY